MLCDKCDRENREDANFCDNCGQNLAHISGRNKVAVALDSDPGAQTQPIDESTTQEQLSSLLGGRYELKEMLGRGGMGVVYRAHDQHLGMDIAIKFLLDRFVDDPSAVASLKREAKAAMRLAHPNILRLYNFEDTPEAKYLLMEFVAGESLASSAMRKPKGRFTEQEVRKYMAGVCDGLSYAHGEGIVHRDIKPSNIMITQEDHVKLADFGIAHFKEAAGSQFNLGGGTPIYMSPEQIVDMGIDGRSDLYSLGVTMYHMLAGSAPFTGDDVRHSHLHVTPKPIRGVSDWMNTVVLKCLRKEPDGRWCNAAELRDILKGKKEIGVTMQGFYQPEWLRTREHEKMAGAKTPMPKPSNEEPKAPERRRLALNKDAPIRSSKVSGRTEKSENRTGAPPAQTKQRRIDILLGMVAGVLAGASVGLIGRSSRVSISEELLFQFSWILYGVLIGAAVGIAKRRPMRVLVSLMLGLSGGTAAVLFLKVAGSLTILRNIDPAYFALPCAVTVGAFIGVADGIHEKSITYSARCLGWAVVGSAIAAAVFLCARFVPAFYERPFLGWILIGTALGFFLNYFVDFAGAPTGKKRASDLY